MNKNIFKSKYLQVLAALIILALGIFILQKPLFIAFWLLIFSVFTCTVIILLRKIDFLEKQNNINIERFAVSLEHVSNVLFDNVLEADITNNQLIGENAKKLTNILQISSTSSYSQTIDAISRKIVDKNYAEEYRKTLSPENILQTLEQGKNTLEYECIERSDGENYRWIRVHYCIYKSNVTNCVMIISYVKNIEAEKRAYHRLVEKATTDQMTGVLNKMSTKEILTDLLKNYPNESSTILMIDIDNFKTINDTYGHNVGDEVIVAICNIIKSNFRDTDIIGRMGGDEFLVCLREKFNYDNIHTKVNRLLNEVHKFNAEYNQQLINNITVSIGIVNTFGNRNFDQLYHYADAAMYKAKAQGKNQYYVYDYTN